jgi:hypothetical protein
MATQVAKHPARGVHKLAPTPWKVRARASRALRRHLDAQRLVTPPLRLERVRLARPAEDTGRSARRRTGQEGTLRHLDRCEMREA